ncbi:MAG: hypothetical protein EB127_16990 [Alphaproteobacteria bacterium]|nr:hypothetical protein [Alphaproteobacteria bacterium]
MASSGRRTLENLKREANGVVYNYYALNKNAFKNKYSNTSKWPNNLWKELRDANVEHRSMMPESEFNEKYGPGSWKRTDDAIKYQKNKDWEEMMPKSDFDAKYGLNAWRKLRDARPRKQLTQEEQKVVSYFMKLYINNMKRGRMDNNLEGLYGLWRDGHTLRDLEATIPDTISEKDEFLSKVMQIFAGLSQGLGRESKGQEVIKMTGGRKTRRKRSHRKAKSRRSRK